MPTRKSEAEWHGTLREGRGQMKIGNDTHARPFTFASRFEDAAASNPEELIAAAHAGCFSMQLSGLLTAGNHPPKSIHTTAKVHIEASAKGADITTIDLETRAEVPGIDHDTFMKMAEMAKEICPVSKALKAVKINVKATLLK
jgi:osmotically inducible protein OsmC